MRKTLVNRFISIKKVILLSIIITVAFAWLSSTRKPETSSLDFKQLKTSQSHETSKNILFSARDGHSLGYRFFKKEKHETLVILLHGSSYHGTYLLPLAHELSECADVCVSDIRGHGLSSPPKGTCEYIGQLEDDLADLITHLDKPYKKTIIIGHSSGGGLAIRFASGKYKNMAHSLILLSPAIITAPTMKTQGAHSWAHIEKITLAECLACNPFGITRFNKKPLITFNKPKELCDGSETLTYDYNLMVSMHPQIPYEKALKKIQEKTLIIVGSDDEINKPEAFKKLFKPESVIILEGVNHMGITTNEQATATIKKHL